MKWYRLGLAAMYWMRKFAAPIPTVRHVTLLLPMFPIYVYPPSSAVTVLSPRFDRPPPSLTTWTVDPKVISLSTQDWVR